MVAMPISKDSILLERFMRGERTMLYVQLIKRISGSLIGALIFFVITNFGVWILGSYGYTLSGLVNCYILAIPFFTYSIISTLLFSSIIEMVCKLKPLSVISLD